MPTAELLSPAGGWDSLKAAVSEGADAVYFGLADFNARRRAVNFGDDELDDAVGYCHVHGVRAYLAANTLVKNGELEKYFKLLAGAYSSGVDAVIVQELPFIPLIKKNFPGMEVHVSTQAGVFNSHYRNLLGGADRVILPRELTINQVREFIQKTGIPAEVFVQGALCFSVSGQCLMSSFLGGRSGNRGLCAQPCRKKYNGRYILSTRDLCLVEKLPQIAEAGVSGLKIEGRLRGPEYVGAATALYRRALDSLESGNFTIDYGALEDVELAFSRGYTRGGMFKEYDVTTPDACGKRGVFLGRLGRGGSIKLDAGIRVGDGVGVFTARGGVHGDVIGSMERGGRRVESAQKGQTVKLNINAGEGDEIVLTSGAMRRKEYAVKRNKAIVVRRRRVVVKLPAVVPNGFDEVRLLAKTYSVRDARAAKEAGASAAYYSVFERDYPRGDPAVCPYVPRCLFEWNAEQALELVAEAKPASVLSGDLGVASGLRGCEVRLDVSCNAFNDVDVGYFNGRGMIPTISPELTFSELKQFRDKRFMVYAHGRIQLMTSKYVLRDSELSDERGYVFPVRSEGAQKQVLNSVPFGLFGEAVRLRKEGIVEYLLDLEEDVAGTVTAYRRILAGARVKKPAEYTLGHFKKGVA